LQEAKSRQKTTSVSANDNWFWKNPDINCKGISKAMSKSIEPEKLFVTEEECETDRQNAKLKMGIFGKLAKYFADSDPDDYEKIFKIISNYDIDWFKDFKNNVLNHPKADELMQKKIIKRDIKPPNYEQRYEALYSKLREGGLPEQQKLKIKGDIKVLQNRVKVVEEVRMQENAAVREELERAYFLGIIGKKTPLELCEERVEELRTMQNLDENSEQYQQALKDLVSLDIDTSDKTTTEYEDTIQNLQKTVEEQGIVIEKLKDEAALLISQLPENIQKGEAVKTYKELISSYLEGFFGKIARYIPSG
jgi:hypothetical protein